MPPLRGPMGIARIAYAPAVGCSVTSRGLVSLILESAAMGSKSRSVDATLDAMIARLLALVAMAVIACEPSRGASHPTSSAASGAEPNDEACPVTFQAGGPCELEDAPKCAYPEGTCTCGTGSYCGGVPPSPEIEAELRKPRWVCKKTPVAIREDGCPGSEPAHASACSEEGRSCSYGDCCIVTARCEGGVWNVGPESCPP